MDKEKLKAIQKQFLSKRAKENTTTIEDILEKY